MSPESRPRPQRDFYEIQKTQKYKSLAVFAFLLLFYVLGVGLLMLIVWAAVSAASGRLLFFAEPGFWAKFALADGTTAAVLAAIQYRSGGAFVLKRLRAVSPDASDRYHREMENVVEALRLAAGLPRIKAVILPDWAVNSRDSRGRRQRRPFGRFRPR